MMVDRTLNDQPKTGGHDGRWYVGEARTEGSLGGMLNIILVAIELGGLQKL